MIRPGKFKHRLLDEAFLQSAQMDEAIVIISYYADLHRQKKLTDWEWVALYIFILSAFRRPLDFQGGLHNQFTYLGTQYSFLLRDLAQKLPPIKLRTELHDQDFFSHFCNTTLRSIPLAVQISLSNWSHGVYPLKLYDSIPSPVEVMNMQAQGYRCVSVLTAPELLRKFIDGGRDALGFTVHDLIHAHHFFSDRQQAQAQVRFTQYIQKLHAHPAIQERLSLDIEFLGEWYYLISDMNTAPLHLFKTLKAILLASVKREFQIPFNQALNDRAQHRFDELLNLCSSIFMWPEPQQQAWQKLNSPQFNMPEDALLLVSTLC